MLVNNYFDVARRNETAFRNILRDLKNNREQRPMGLYIPKDLETEANLEVIFEKYSLGDGYGIFTIHDFLVDGGFAIIRFRDIAFLSGGGAGLKYLVKKGGTVEYLKSEYSEYIVMS